MILKIADDIPDELINIAKVCNFDIIPKDQRQNKLNELSNLANKYIPRKDNLNNVKYHNIEVGTCPNELANLINQMDFNKISTFQKKLALPFIKNYLKNNGFMK